MGRSSDLPPWGLDLRLLPAATRRRVAALVPRCDSLDDLLATLGHADRRLVEALLDDMDDEDEDEDDEEYDEDWDEEEEEEGWDDEPGVGPGAEGHASVAESAPPIGATEARWRGWLEAHRLPDWFGKSIHHAFPGTWFGGVPPGATVGSLLVGTTKIHVDKWRTGLGAADVRDLVVREAARIQEALAVDAAREPLHHVPPPLPAWNALHAIRAPLRTPGAVAAGVDRVRIGVLPDLALEIRTSEPWRRERFDLLSASFRNPPDVRSVDALLDWFATPSDDRDAVTRALAEPAWSRALRKIVDAVASSRHATRSAPSSSNPRHSPSRAYRSLRLTTFSRPWLATTRKNA